MKVSKGLLQAYEVQDFTHSAIMALKDSLLKDGKLTITREDAQAIANLTKSWDSAQERVRIHRNKPLPGTISREKLKSGPKKPRLNPFSSAMIEFEPRNGPATPAV